MLQRLYDSYRPNRYELKPFLLKDGERHKFAIVCPGGGYRMVCSSGEGHPIAKELNKCGYHAFVLYYRVKKKGCYPNPQQDLKRAVEEVLSHADEWMLDVDSWSIWGSSAGGHLVASYCTEDWGTPKPGALVLSYPVISMGEYTHTGSRDTLLGKNASADMIKKMSVECQVNSDYPPVFVWYGTADETVAPVNSKMLCDVLTESGVPNKAEEYEGIGHGAGLAKGTIAEAWFRHAVDFWESQM